MKRLWIVGALAATFLIAAAQPALASWQQQSTPSPAGLVSSEMAGLWCPTGASCTAVGNYVDGSGSHALAEVSSAGSNWSLETVPSPAGATAAELNGVYCHKTSFCMAVGDYTDGSGQHALSEEWNGGGWSIISVPEPGGATAGQLTGVSCSSTSACTAVGSVTVSSGEALGETFSGGTWSLASIPVPAGATSSQLGGVACPSASTCTAAGAYEDGSGQHPLVETSSGSTWTIQTVPGPTGASSLDAVACHGTSSCMVVGYDQADLWNGTTWTLENVATPHPHSGLTDLGGVSCPSTTVCYGVGSYYSEGVLTAVGEMWNGKKWAVQSTPLSTSYDENGFSAVSCPDSNLCAAVGFYHDPVDGDRAWVESNQLRWQVQTIAPPSGSIASSLSAISCTSTKACMAVDSFEASGSVFGTSAQQWNGSGWTDISTPNSSNSLLSGVSCTAANACEAVGDVFSGPNLVPLAEVWNGTTWTVQSTPAPSGATNSYLLAVSCQAANFCMAVGEYRTSGGDQFTLSESWNGSTWTLQTTPNPAGTTTDDLNWVSCPIATDCEAVGSASPGGNGTLVEGWNGTSWTIQTVSLPAGGSDGYLAGVDCVSATACTAVGDYFNGSHQVPLGEGLTGTTWSALTMGVPPGVRASGLAGVSCLSATNCIAVGFADYKTSGLQPVGEHGTAGVWRVNVASVPSSVPSGMASVACPKITFCEGVGYYTPSGGNNSDLAEQWS